VVSSRAHTYEHLQRSWQSLQRGHKGQRRHIAIGIVRLAQRCLVMPFGRNCASKGRSVIDAEANVSWSDDAASSQAVWALLIRQPARRAPDPQGGEAAGCRWRFGVGRARTSARVVPFASLSQSRREAIKAPATRAVMRAWQVGEIFLTDNGSVIHAQVRRARLQLFCNTASQFTHA